MTIANVRMLGELDRVSLLGAVLRGELLAIVERGFYECLGCFFLIELYSKGRNVSMKDFPDKTGFECFVNSIHIDDHVGSNYIAAAIVFVGSVFDQWRAMGGEGRIKSIVSCTEFGVCVKFHFVRDGEEWVSGSLDEYEEAILVSVSDEEEWREWRSWKSGADILRKKGGGEE